MYCFLNSGSVGKHQYVLLIFNNNNNNNNIQLIYLAYLSTKNLRSNTIKLPEISSDDDCVASSLYRNRHLNFIKTNDHFNVILSHEDRVAIATECIDFKFTPVTKIIVEDTLPDGRVYSNKRQILPDGLSIIDYDDHLVHVNNLTMQLLGIADCVNDIKHKYSTPSEIKESCLPLIKNN